MRKNECRNEFYGRAVNSRPPCGGASKQGACMSPTAQQCVRLPCRFACDGPMPPKAHSAGCGQAGSGRRAAPPPQSIVWLSACPDICSAGDSPGGGSAIWWEITGADDGPAFMLGPACMWSKKPCSCMPGCICTCCECIGCMPGSVAISAQPAKGGASNANEA